jgi:hypothetical protein
MTKAMSASLSWTNQVLTEVRHNHSLRPWLGKRFVRLEALTGPRPGHPHRR